MRPVAPSVVYHYIQSRRLQSGDFGGVAPSSAGLSVRASCVR